MQRETIRRIAILAGGFLSVWLFLKYLFPIFLPFGLGLLLAISAEPAVRLGNRFSLPRWAAAGLGVSLTLIFLFTLVWLLGAAAVKELGILANRLPDLQGTAENATATLRHFLERAASHAPAGVQPLMDQSISRMLSSGSVLMEQATVRLPGAISSLLSRIPNGALGIGTGILSGYMFSVRLPKLKQSVKDKIPKSVQTRLLPALKESKTALLGWLKAQLKLSSITFGIVTIGLLLLRIPFAPVWAGLVALVDAVPLLGTGTVLLPWALISYLQGLPLRAVGMLGIYLAAFLTRTALEPRLVGRHLGLDPLVTLLFLYLGYRFWGILGMLLAPMLAAALTAASQAIQLPTKEA